MASDCCFMGKNCEVGLVPYDCELMGLLYKCRCLTAKLTVPRQKINLIHKNSCGYANEAALAQ